MDKADLNQSSIKPESKQHSFGDTNTIWTSVSQVKLVTLEEFVETLYVRHQEKDLLEYKVLTKTPTYFTEPTLEEQLEKNVYDQRQAYLTNDLTLDNIVSDIVSQSKTIMVPKTSLEQVIEEGARESCVNMGVPDYAVRIDDHTYFIAETDTMALFKGPNGSKLVIFEPNKNVVVKIT